VSEYEGIETKRHKGMTDHVAAQAALVGMFEFYQSANGETVLIKSGRARKAFNIDDMALGGMAIHKYGETWVEAEDGFRFASVGGAAMAHAQHLLSMIWLPPKGGRESVNEKRELRLVVAAVNPASELFGPVRITATPKQLETLFGFPPNGEDDPHKVDRCWWVKRSDGSDAANIYAYKQKNAAETDELSWSIQGTSEEYVDALHESIQEQVASFKVSEDV